MTEQDIVSCPNCQKLSYAHAVAPQSPLSVRAPLAPEGWVHLVDYAGVAKLCHEHAQAQPRPEADGGDHPGADLPDVARHDDEVT